MGLHGAVKSAYLGLGKRASNSRLLDYKWFLEQEVNTWNTWLPVPAGRRLWLWRRGFTSPAGVLYDFESHDAADYLSELQQYRFYSRFNGRHRYLIDDKLSQHWMMGDHPQHRPKAFGLVDGGYVHGLAGTAFSGEPTAVADWLPQTLREESRVVMKQLRGMGGKQVRVCAYDEDFSLDGEPISEEALCAEIAELSGYLVTEYISQHEYAEALYPRSTNTVRLLTLWDERREEILLPMAIHRIGTERSRPVDNWSVGGLSAEIDPESGELGRAAQFPSSRTVPWYSNHPDTGARIEGTTVPHWERIVATIERLALDNTQLPAIGWDVVIDESGQPIVIEANSGTDIDLMQVHRPLLENPAIADLFGRYLPEIESGDYNRS